MDEQPIKTPQPNNVTIDQTTSGLVLTYRWFSPKFIFLALFCVIWDGFLVFWYAIALGGNSSWEMILFPVLHIALGIGLTYYTVAGFINRTVITVGQGRLSIEHGPMMWFGSWLLNSTEISQIYVEEIVTRGKHGPSTSFQLNAITQDGRKIKLMGGFESADSARFIENKVEEWLGIHDRKVEGELQK
ncbi:MAG: hypothetical protein V1799_08700 [bacterium]